jgi:hypothetical protein
MANDMGAPRTNAVDRMIGNPWILATIFLAVVLVVVLVMGRGGVSGKAVSEDVAAQNLLSFIKAQGSGEATLVSNVKNGSFYQITVEYNGQNIPVYVTADGKYLVPSLVPLDSVPSDNAAAADTADGADAADTPAPTVTKSDKPKVEVFVMSYCPYGTQIEKGILPVAKLLGSKIDFSIKFVSYAMHGEKEITENTLQYCIQKEQSSKLDAYMTCFLKAGDSESCLTSAGIDKTKLTSCTEAADKQFNITANFENKDTWLSGNYPMYNVNKAENDEYGVQGSPTLVINGAQASSARDSASLLKAICAAFNTAPSECSDTVSSAAPSPGFGEAAAASGGSAGGCGG